MSDTHTAGPAIARAARPEDLPELVRMYAATCDAMHGTPYDVDWVMGEHPTEEGLLAEIDRGNVVVAVGNAADNKNRVLGAGVVNHKQEVGYERAPWAVDAAPERVAVVHLLAVDPAARGLGIGELVMGACADMARDRGDKSMRLDVWPQNRPAIALYERCGMEGRGVWRMEYDDYVPTDVLLMELPLV